MTLNLTNNFPRPMIYIKKINAILLSISISIVHRNKEQEFYVFKRQIFQFVQSVRQTVEIVACNLQ